MASKEQHLVGLCDGPGSGLKFERVNGEFPVLCWRMFFHTTDGEKIILKVGDKGIVELLAFLVSIAKDCPHLFVQGGELLKKWIEEEYRNGTFGRSPLGELPDYCTTAKIATNLDVKTFKGKF